MLGTLMRGKETSTLDEERVPEELAQAEVGRGQASAAVRSRSAHAEKATAGDRRAALCAGLRLGEASSVQLEAGLPGAPLPS